MGYLAGDSLTGVDVWLFNTLVRFDPVYVVYFKTCKRTISSYHNITNYIRDLYQTHRLGLALTCGLCRRARQGDERLLEFKTHLNHVVVSSYVCFEKKKKKKKKKSTLR